MAMKEVQDQIDTEALKIASELKGSVNMMNQILKSHLDDCISERRVATQQRTDFRVETENNFVNIHTRISGVNNRIVTGMAATIMLLLGLCGFLFIKANGW